MAEASEFSTISFCTYNVLSSALAAPSYHNGCEPEHVDNEARFQKLLGKLEGEVEKGSIITLQEVSELWSGKLAVFFANSDYSSHSRCYGNDFNGYMGVLIAFPTAHYSLVDLESKRISDTAYWPEDDRHENFNGRDYSDKTLKSLDAAQRKWNATMWMQLVCKDTKKSFCVATYHMPCMYKDQKAMDVHAGLLVRYVQEKSKGLPTILGGDFNSKPNSSAYEMITSGRPKSLVASMFHNHKDNRKVSFGDDISANKNRNSKKNKKKKAKGPLPELKRNSGVGKFTTLAAFKSAYATFLKKEPVFTNYARRGGERSRLFADCIDYIFITEEFEVLDVLELYASTDEVKDNSFPGEKEPSDHLLLRATLKL